MFQAGNFIVCDTIPDIILKGTITIPIVYLKVLYK